MRPRSIGRRLALQYLFMADLNGYADVETPSHFFQIQREAVLDSQKSAEGQGGGFRFDQDDPYQDEAEAFALQLIREVETNQEEIDRSIEKAAQNWTLSRMGRIERNVIRLAAAELRIGSVPRGVVLDEAVELAKRFGDKESGAFVNGIADRLSGGSRDGGGK